MLCQRAYRFLPKEDQFRILGKICRSRLISTIETCKKISGMSSVVQNMLKTAIESEDEISEKKNIIMKILMRLIYMYHSTKDYSVAISSMRMKNGQKICIIQVEHEFSNKNLNYYQILCLKFI